MNIIGIIFTKYISSGRKQNAASFRFNKRKFSALRLHHDDIISTAKPSSETKSRGNQKAIRNGQFIMTDQIFK